MKEGTKGKKDGGKDEGRKEKGRKERSNETTWNKYDIVVIFRFQNSIVNNQE